MILYLLFSFMFVLEWWYPSYRFVGFNGKGKLKYIFKETTDWRFYTFFHFGNCKCILSNSLEGLEVFSWTGWQETLAAWNPGKVCLLITHWLERKLIEHDCMYFQVVEQTTVKVRPSQRSEFHGWQISITVKLSSPPTAKWALHDFHFWFWSFGKASKIVS